VQITDFGLALVDDATEGKYTSARGTAGWLAPERYSSTPGMTRTPNMDVWAFGLLCFSVRDREVVAAGA
jgi:serine/threonine protein kinase